MNLQKRTFCLDVPLLQRSVKQKNHDIGVIWRQSGRQVPGVVNRLFMNKCE